MKYLLILCLQFAICNNTLASSDCLESVTLLQKGDPSPCTGFLFSPDAEAQAESDSRDAKYYKLLSERLDERSVLILNQNEILEKRIQLYIEQNNTLANEVVKKERRSEWQKVGYFLLGVGVTSLAVYGAAQLK
jgi:hypothetical protein